MKFKAQLLNLLEHEFHVTPHVIAEGMSQVIRGETVVEKQKADGSVIGRTVTRTPKDILNGAMIYDALRGGDLGLTPRTLPTDTEPSKVTHRRLEMDNRIIANKIEEPTVLELIADESE